VIVISYQHNIILFNVILLFCRLFKFMHSHRLPHILTHTLNTRPRKCYLFDYSAI